MDLQLFIDDHLPEVELTDFLWGCFCHCYVVYSHLDVYFLVLYLGVAWFILEVVFLLLVLVEEELVLVSGAIVRAVSEDLKADSSSAFAGI